MAPYIGTATSRVDGVAKVTGAAKYAAEINVPGLLHGSIVCSTIAKGRVARIDTTAASGVDGVITVLTHENRPPMADDDEAPSWNDKPLAPDLDEIHTVAVLVGRVLQRQDLYPLPEKKRDLVQSVQQRLTKILESGKVVAADRTWLLWNARLLLVTVF